ncbi:MAG: hypothetical protein K5655_03865 [Lachnospiraceae bacterium]|nr:hypothetical protein [Lachnospiraceae bacterium]
MGLADSAIAQFTGNPVLGVITILDTRPLAPSNEGQPATNVSTKRKIATTGNGGNTDRFTAGLSANPMDPNKPGNRRFEEIAAGKGAKKSFEVQFNPAGITIQAQGGGMAQVTNVAGDTKGSDVGGSIKYTTMDPRITVTIPLIFDSVVNADAFLEDKLNTSLSSIAKNVANAVTTGLGEVHTVQTQVEGLISVLRNDYTRQIMFSWSEMSYIGLINGVNAQYTMFSPLGRPIRAVVTLTLLCTDKDVRSGTMGQWEDRYRAAFVKENGDNMISNVTAGQKVGTLFNIG